MIDVCDPIMTGGVLEMEELQPSHEEAENRQHLNPISRERYGNIASHNPSQQTLIPNSQMPAFQVVCHAEDDECEI